MNFIETGNHTPLLLAYCLFHLAGVTPLSSINLICVKFATLFSFPGGIVLTVKLMDDPPVSGFTRPRSPRSIWRTLLAFILIRCCLGSRYSLFDCPNKSRQSDCSYIRGRLRDRSKSLLRTDFNAPVFSASLFIVICCDRMFTYL